MGGTKLVKQKQKVLSDDRSLELEITLFVKPLRDDFGDVEVFLIEEALGGTT